MSQQHQIPSLDGITKTDQNPIVAKHQHQLPASLVSHLLIGGPDASPRNSGGLPGFFHHGKASVVVAELIMGVRMWWGIALS